ncbi:MULTISPECIES: hypothetical protein [Spongiibacter]|nr:MULTISPECIES: hypothetical protein [Spongiibacter]MBM7423830.1 hypothetical protein [Spongiibacter marinus]
MGNYAETIELLNQAIKAIEELDNMWNEAVSTVAAEEELLAA